MMLDELCGSGKRIRYGIAPRKQAHSSQLPLISKTNVSNMFYKCKKIVS